MDRVARFWSRVDRSGDCWIWTGSIKPNGYGQVSWNLRSRYTHRIAYEITHGPIPAGLDICHRCDNPPCVNPAHLFAATHEENMNDAIRKGRKQSYLKLNAQQVREIRSALASGACQSDLARKYTVTRATISLIALGKTWRSVQ